LHHRVPSINHLRCCCIFTAMLVVLLCEKQSTADEFTELARVSMRLQLLQQTWHRDLVEQDPVRTQVMDARVEGRQTTSVSVRLTAEPGTRMAQLYLHSTGRVQSSTAGYTEEARVDSLGNHSFQLTKPVFFDGRRFLTRRAHGSLTARTQPVAVRTAFSGLPLLGAFGDQIAWAETYRRQPVTNSIVVRQVADDVVPEFDTRVEAELAEANRDWARVRQNITRLLPQYNVDWQAGSTGDGVTLKLGIREPPGTYTASRPLLQTTMRPDPLPQEDLVVSLSDDMVNELLRGLPLKGLTVTDATLNGLGNFALEDVFTDGKLHSTPDLRDVLSASAVLFSLQFSDETPLEVRFEPGHVAVVLRFRVIPKIGQTTDLHRLTLRIKGADGDRGQWALRVDDVDVTSEGSDAATSSLTNIIHTQARSMLVDQPPALIPRLARLHAETGLPDLHLRNLRSRDGVLRASFQLTQTAVQSGGR
jgi:hypothetical protein